MLSLEDDGDKLEEAVLTQLTPAHVQLLQVLRPPVDGGQLSIYKRRTKKDQSVKQNSLYGTK